MTRDEAATVVLERVLGYEGGIAQVPGESWVTSFGQTPQWLQAFGFQAPTTVEEALGNYRTWLVRTRLIGLCDAPDVLAVAVIDWAVQSGHTIPIAALQRALGVKVDAILGPETQEAVDGCMRRWVASSVIAQRGRFFGELITGNPTKYARYAKGWMARLGDQVDDLFV
jgi:lysozyme family protein